MGDVGESIHNLWHNAQPLIGTVYIDVAVVYVAPANAAGISIRFPGVLKSRHVPHAS